jgi:hypothetical protein
VQASKTWVTDRTHGLQFSGGFLEASPPTTLAGIGTLSRLGDDPRHRPGLCATAGAGFQ